MTPEPTPPTTFTRLACGACPDLDRFLVALTAEFRLVEVTGVLATLDRLALDVGLVSGLPPAHQADALRTALGDLRAMPAHDLDAVSLDRVLERRAGHAIVLAAVVVLVGRRAGVPLGILMAAGRPLVVHRRAAEPLVLDPAAGLAAVDPDELADARWRCPHQVAYHLLTALCAGTMERGDIGLAIRAAELRLALPCDAESRTVLELELNRLRAHLN